MRVLVIGGSGRVGTGVLPFLAKDYDVRVFDLRPPQVSGLAYVAGSVLDSGALTAAMRDVDGLIYMAMNREFHDFSEGCDVNARGVYYALDAAREVGLTHVVHTSTGSVHNERAVKRFDDESLPLDAWHVYGLTKGMGEMACQYFARVHGMSVVALRLFGPCPHESWLEDWRRNGRSGLTTFRDTARAFDLALNSSAHTGFDAVFISGDYTGQIVNCDKAKRLLGWEPLDRFEEG